MVAFEATRIAPVTDMTISAVRTTLLRVPWHETP
jgi:hypothetical protein